MLWDYEPCIVLATLHCMQIGCRVLTGGRVARPNRVKRQFSQECLREGVVLSYFINIVHYI